MDSGSKILAAARVPLQKVNIPFRFRLTTQNALADCQDLWNESLKDSDIAVGVKVCQSKDSTSKTENLVCQPTTGDTFEAKAVAKLLKLPNGSIIRAPASLAI